jgi:hypothetical protein
MNRVRKILLYIALLAVNVVYSESREQILADYIDKYAIRFEFEGEHSLKRVECPRLIVSSLSKQEELSLRGESLWRGVSIDFKIEYLNSDSQLDRARWFSSTSLLPPGAIISEGGVVTTYEPIAVGVSMIQGEQIVDLCSHLEWFKRSLLEFEQSSKKLELQKIKSIELQFGFKDLLVIPGIPDDAGVYFYTNRYRLEGELLNEILISTANRSVGVE